jgi:hypothetical protein
MKPVYTLVTRGISLQEMEEHYSYADVLGVIAALNEANKKA